MTRYIIPVLLILISGGIALFYIDGEYKRIQTIRAEQVVINEDITRADKVDDDLAALRQEFESFPSGATERLAVMLPEKVDNVKLLVDLEGIASKHGLFLKGPEVSISENKRDENTGVRVPEEQPATVRFVVTGPYRVFREFLRDIERSLVIHDMSVVGFSGDDAPRGVEPVYNFQVEVYTYFIK